MSILATVRLGGARRDEVFPDLSRQIYKQLNYLLTYARTLALPFARIVEFFTKNQEFDLDLEEQTA